MHRYVVCRNFRCQWIWGDDINHTPNEGRNQMTKKSFSILSMLIILALIATISIVFAQTSPDGFRNEPDQSMAKAHETFVKGEMNKASESIAKAATYVKKEAREVR